ncbi:MAG: T9SS type A sorting domain-containing protein [Bacteroidales bacterium]|nr:T9SS type A sorting domain-containing protein [Bacteroidales bacterium]MCB9013160.1 T9SS type A sorting domain-containing protein [Bacteroidales bacterium]
MKSLFNILYFLSFGFCFGNLYAQEIVIGLQGNPQAENYYSMHQAAKKAGPPVDTIELPFIDDFSDSYVEPKYKLWSDKYAFINSSYAVYPPTIGVATLDALNYNGSQYPNASSLPYQADYLTSQRINLQYPASDSIYLSFFYQAGGLAEPPETGDSLLLDFYSPIDTLWTKVWAMHGNIKTDTFYRVMIKIDSDAYLQKGFRFRFRNYASYIANNDYADKRANTDLWHIDYVKLDKGRTIGDTLLHDVSFMDPIRSIMKDYTSVPWKHFAAAYNTQRAPFIEVVIKNHDDISRLVGTGLEIRDKLVPGPVYKVTEFNNNIGSGDSIHYKYAYNYPFNFGVSDSAEFEIKAILKTDSYDYKPNDTLIHNQKFYNYYALDDGTAEASYGLRGAGSKDVSSALKFTSYQGDSLRAVDIYFAQVIDSINQKRYFYLNVWKDNSGKPGTVLANQIGMQPKYTDRLNKFARYDLDSAVYIEGVFYIGFTQTTEELLNVGLDLNRENKARIFNNFDNGIWQTTTVLPGTPMMRPVFSSVKLVSAVTEIPEPEFMLYPNPADQVIFIKNKNSSVTGFSEAELIDISGRIIKKIDLSEENTFGTENLENGLYFIRIHNSLSKKITTQKVVISH